MCGINGYIDFSSTESKDSILIKLKKMNESIAHRGPDGGGELVNQNIGVAMKRLSIIDLSLGNQPMSHPNYGVSIVFNGEIYNYKEIKKELLKKNYIFHTNSDTEVIIVAYIAYGINFIQHLKGMFSFCLIDNNTKTTYIFRDRAGEKPLYFTMINNKFIFSSELKGILASGVNNMKIDKIALNQFLQLRYIPSPLTIFEGVFKLKPGHYIEIKENSYKEICYWKLSPVQTFPLKDANTYSKVLYKLLDEAVEGCLEADVPIGVFLSGGIDSSIITSLASLKSKKPINTYTIKFKEKEYDESKRAKLISKKYKTNHTEIELSRDSIRPYLSDLFKLMDEPFADPSLLPTYVVSKEARKFVKVIITGDGADELFAGYNKYLIFYYSQRFNKLPFFLRKIIMFFVSKLNKDKPLYRVYSKVINNSEKSELEMSLSMMVQGFNDKDLSRLLLPIWHNSTSLDFIRQKLTNSKYSNTVSKVLNTDFQITLEGDMLNKMDRGSMYGSLETRTPFLDKNIIEFANSLPIQMKIRGTKRKIVLRKAFSKLLTYKTLNFSKKGFSIPLADWFRNELKDEIIEFLDKDFLSSQKIFNFDFVNLLFQDHLNFKNNNSEQLWTFLVFQKWFKSHKSYM